MVPSRLSVPKDKKCRCCGRDVGSEEKWAELAYVAEQVWDDGEVHELRNCPCGGTLVVIRVAFVPCQPGLAR